jgi:MarR family transcriptional regulator for hemolysin
VRSEPQSIGLDVARTGRVVSRAFDEELVRAGGSLPTWLILLAIKRADHTMQRDLAASIGIEGATVTHHLNRMERDCLVTRQRSPENRRNETVTLTPEGEAFFQRLLHSVVAFDRQLPHGPRRREARQLAGVAEPAAQQHRHRSGAARAFVMMNAG